MFVRTFKDLILLWTVAAADVFVMNDENHICRKARIINCKKIFKYFQTNLLFLRIAGFLVLFFNIHKNIDSNLKRSLVGFGSKLHKHSEV